MFVHAEGEEDDLNDGDLSCFIRLGTDFTSNYYEYEILIKTNTILLHLTKYIWPSSK